MSNLSKMKREEMLKFLEKLREKHTDDATIIAINEIETALTEKKYGLVWEEHSERVDEELKTKIPVFTEVEDKEINKDKKAPYNFLIEGDNLHSLYLLEKTHRGEIDMIYIDPPYNTKKKDFIFDDKYVDQEDGYKHSKWLSFMNNRLRIARELLKDDGFICISIDDNEQAVLKVLCDDIFGEENFITNFHVQVRYADKSLNEEKPFKPLLEYVIIYAKDCQKFIPNQPTEYYTSDKFIYEISEFSDGELININGHEVTVFKKGEWDIKKHKNGDSKYLKETWITGSVYTTMSYGKVFKEVVEPRVKIDGLGCLYKVHGRGDDGLGYRYYTGPKRKNAKRGKMYSGIPLYRLEEMETEHGSLRYIPIPNFYDYSADFGNIRHEGGVAFNSGKKPVKMLKQLINFHTRKNITVLDFFAGSGSTGHAVLDLNKEDDGNRKFIICTNNENNICEEVTYQRMLNIKTDYVFNLKYYKTDYIDRFGDEEEYISDELMKYIKEMVQLEHHIKIDNERYIILYDDEDLKEFMQDKKKLNSCKELYKPSHVFFDTQDIKEVNDREIKIITIPEYYFARELKEVGEL